MSESRFVKISGIGMSVPENIVTNDDLTKFLDTSDEWISTRTGIKQRRVVDADVTAVDLGTKAAQDALNRANIKSEDVQIIISATSVPTNLYPSTACEIQSNIGAKNAACYDISAACSGFIYGLTIAKGYIKSGMYENVLLVATDANTKFVDWQDRSICVLFGDGAGACVLKKSEEGPDDIVNIDIKSDGSIGNFITMPLSGKPCPLVKEGQTQPLNIKMNGKDVYKFVVSTLPAYIEKCILDANLKPEDIDYLVPHQANLRIIDAIQQRLGYSEEKVITNIEFYGNTSAASVPIALVEGIEKGKIKTPSTAVLCGFGAGMTWGAAIVKLSDGVV